VAPCQWVLPSGSRVDLRAPRFAGAHLRPGMSYIAQVKCSVVSPIFSTLGQLQLEIARRRHSGPRTGSHSKLTGGLAELSSSHCSRRAAFGPFFFRCPFAYEAPSLPSRTRWRPGLPPHLLQGQLAPAARAREAGAEGSMGRTGVWDGREYYEYGAERSMGRNGVWGGTEYGAQGLHTPTHRPPL
jgi:hypothetical protein